ncbi:MAG: replication-associated recombination protein A, partial [Bacillota bacterium]|nr:replication-associated recombination protein A [Bacillota bacterium]
SSYVALDRYLAHIKKEGAAPVPLHLRDAHYPGARILGHGRDYRYPHSYPGHFVRQPYLPPEVPRVYEPGELGWEGMQGPEVKRRWKDGEHGKGPGNDRGPEAKDSSPS